MVNLCHATLVLQSKLFIIVGLDCPAKEIEFVIIVFQEDGTPVMLATKNGHTDVVKFLVDHGADIHRQRAVSCFSLLLKVI